MHTCMHIHLSKIVTAMSRFTASGLEKKEQYSCLYSRAIPKVWLYLYSIHVVGCNNIKCKFTSQHNCDVVKYVNTSNFMLTLLHQIELEVKQKTRESILKHSIEAI